jgi:hypothetical protein
LIKLIINTKFWGKEMKSILLLLLFLVFMNNMVEAKILKDSLYQIPKTKVVPVIDGIQDNIWKVVDWNMQRIYNVGDPPTALSAADSGVGLSGMSKAMWDGNNLYFLFYSIDNILIDLPSNPPWNQDAIEIYIDGANEKATMTGVTRVQDKITPSLSRANNKTSEATLSGDQHHFIFPHWMKDQEVGKLGSIFGASFDTNGVEFKIRDMTKYEGFPGWMLELKIPLETLGIDGSTAGGQKIGWELQQDDSDDLNAGRQSMSKWWNTSNKSGANAAVWGTTILSTREVDTVLQIVKATKAPVIDGTMDAEYKNANTITTNLFRVGDPPTADSVNTDPLFGGFLTAYPLWDANNLYIFCDVVDRVITDIPTNASWNQDAIELYFDGTCDHSPETSLKAYQYRFIIPHWLMGREVGHGGYAFGTVIDTSGIQFKIVDHDALGNNKAFDEEGAGWNLELKIPLVALGIDGSAPGSKIGFELQLDNSNEAAFGRQGIEKWWNASNNSGSNAGLWGYASVFDIRYDLDRNKPLNRGVRNYTLSQNYPNPFNPSTTIYYALPIRSSVRIQIFNMLGQVITDLVNSEQDPGYHSVNWTAKVASGMYFYRIEAAVAGNPNFQLVDTKKMILLK